MLRAKTLSDQQQVIEQYTFTDLKIGPGAARSDLKSIFEARVRRWISDARPRDEAQSAHTGWTVAEPPTGFDKVTELKRPLICRSICPHWIAIFTCSQPTRCWDRRASAFSTAGDPCWSGWSPAVCAPWKCWPTSSRP